MNKTARRLQILAPAGDAHMLRAAVFSGADCVYLGLRGHNARRAAANFDKAELAEAVAFCHARGCGVHAAVNTLVLPGRQKPLEDAIYAVAEAGCDAIIVQDLAAAQLVKSVAPGLRLHGSTQMSVHSPAGVQQLAELGFACAILARELTEAEIAAIVAASPIDVEVFVHGALCVSVSGQCFASALLGGRSANRGACAGPCRLPFAACAGPPAAPRAPEGTHHLSLKDLSILDALPRLQAMGVASAKIEGRLRGPEYCAVVVDSAIKARDGQPYDKDLLRRVFSRSGFTDGWFTGRGGADMFGARTAADSAQARDALPQARQLYRRERPRVPVQLRLVADEGGAVLQATDGHHTVKVQQPGPLPAARQAGHDALAAALAKTGGTPFYLPAPPVLKLAGVHLSPGQAGALRREALARLLALRQQPAPSALCGPVAASSGLITSAAQRGPVAAVRTARQHNGRPLLRGRFATVGQVPPAAWAGLDALLLPLKEAEAVPAAHRHKVWLYLPRVLFGSAEAEAAHAIQRLAGTGFAGFEAGTIGQLRLCRGQPVSGGFGLNAANAQAAALLVALGCRVLTLSLELSLAQLGQLAGDALLREHLLTDALCYGHLPLMLTRACPLKQATGCGGCPKRGGLLDRKGQVLPVVCSGQTRQVLNPVPLWQAEQLPLWPCDSATLYFTTETAQQAAQVLDAYQKGAPAPGPFTRGCYSKGTQG